MILYNMQLPLDKNEFFQYIFSILYTIKGARYEVRGARYEDKQKMFLLLLAPSC